MHGNNLIHDVTQLIMQLATIILASWVAKTVSEKIKIPSVVGYIITGIILGPSLLGAVPLGDIFLHGLFPKIEATIPVSPYLYSFSAIASLLLLFMSGLETDTDLFIRYSFVGTIVGIGGLIFSFGGAYLLSIFALNQFHVLHPIHLFLGTIATATSVGITTSVLSDQHKINSPEGVTVLSAAVLDDVLGIIVLAIILGITENLINNTKLTGHLLRDIGLTSAKAIGLWLGCTIVGIVYSRKFGRGMKKIFKDTNSIAIISLGLAFLLGGIFELAGLSMVIGAYIMGLTFSNTDLAYVIQEKITPIATMFTPVFFVVTGMLINLQEIIKIDTFLLGLSYAVVCIVAKIVGSGLPSLALGFNRIGALRIGVGMAPRGEIALIIAGIGISFGIIDDRTFGAVLIMIFISAIISPYLLNILLSNPKLGTNNNKLLKENTDTVIDFKHETLKRLVLVDFLQLIEEEGFFINKADKNNTQIFHIRKDDVFIVLTTNDQENQGKLIFTAEEECLSLVKTALYEASANIAESSQVIATSLDAKKLVSSETKVHNKAQLENFMSSSLVKKNLESNNKESIIRELVEMMDQEGLLKSKETFIQELLEREETFSTGMQDGIAMPHAKTQEIQKTSIVIGLKPEGIDFESLDGKPSTIFVLIATKKDTPHLSILSSLSTLLNSEEFRKKLLTSERKIDIINLFST